MSRHGLHKAVCVPSRASRAPAPGWVAPSQVVMSQAVVVQLTTPGHRAHVPLTFGGNGRRILGCADCYGSLPGQAVP